MYRTKMLCYTKVKGEKTPKIFLYNKAFNEVCTYEEKDQNSLF